MAADIISEIRCYYQDRVHKFYNISNELDFRGELANFLDSIDVHIDFHIWYYFYGQQYLLQSGDDWRKAKESVTPDGVLEFYLAEKPNIVRNEVNQNSPVPEAASPSSTYTTPVRHSIRHSSTIDDSPNTEADRQRYMNLSVDPERSRRSSRRYHHSSTSSAIFNSKLSPTISPVTPSLERRGSRFFSISPIKVQLDRQLTTPLLEPLPEKDENEKDKPKKLASRWNNKHLLAAFLFIVFCGVIISTAIGIMTLVTPDLYRLEYSPSYLMTGVEATDRIKKQTQLLNHYRSQNDQYSVASCMGHLADAYYFGSQYEQAEKVLNDAFELVNELDDAKKLGFLKIRQYYNNYALNKGDGIASLKAIYQSSKTISEELTATSQLHYIWELCRENRLNEVQLQGLADVTLSDKQVAFRNLVDAWIQATLGLDAQEEFTETIDEARDINFQALEIQALNDMGLYFLKVQDFSKAMIKFNLWLSKARDSESMYLEAETLLNSAICQEKLGEYTQAVEMTKSGIEIFSRILPSDHEVIKQAKEDLARMLDEGKA